MTARTIRVVARDGALRRSYVFALQAEGFRVDPFASLLSAIGSTPYPRTTCVLVDESALRGIQDGPELLRRLGLPVIIVISGSARTLDERLARYPMLTKPLIGNQMARCIDLLTERSAVGC